MWPVAIIQLVMVHALRVGVIAGLGGLLQSYNASLHIVYAVLSGMKNIQIHDGLSYALHWGFNPLWACCSLLAGGWCLQRVYAAARRGWNSADLSFAER